MTTRHNAGFLFLDYLVDRYGFPDYTVKFKGGITEGMVPLAPPPSFSDAPSAVRMIFLKPMTFMNLSGQSVQAVTRFYKIYPKHILVIHDDVDLPLGTLRTKQGGGNGGHNGLKSIEQSLNSPNFWRLRIGVGRPPSEHVSTSDHVLGAFTKPEFKTLIDFFPTCEAAFQKMIIPQEHCPLPPS